VPRLNGNSKAWDPLIERLIKETELREGVADWLKFPHRIHPLGTQQLGFLARELAALINQRWISNGGFEDVVLIGHSVGGLVARQAYLESIGEESLAGFAWAAKVSRIVLLSVPNRGVPRLPWYGRPVDRFVRLFLFWMRFTYQDLLRGSAFITNLRIQWIRHFSGSANGAPNLPKVLLLRGARDTIVDRDASHDVLAFPNTSYIEVAGGTHENLPLLQTRRGAGGKKELTAEGVERLALMRNAIIGTSESLGLIETSFPRPEPATYKRVIFVLHGIRASGLDHWLSDVAKEIKTTDEDTFPVRPDYGYLTAWRFVLPSVRKRNLRWFQDKYTELLARNPSAEFNFIGHSNGTYMLGQSLLQIPAMRFKRVVLAGSVLPTNFFDSDSPVCIRNQIQAVRSDGGRFDYPVGVLCRILSQVLQMKDVGTGGYDGFTGVFVEQYRYHDGGHGKMLESHQNIQSMVNFALTGESKPEPQILPRSVPFNRLARLAPYFVALVLGLVALGPLVMYRFVNLEAISPMGLSYLSPIVLYLSEVMVIALLAIFLDVL
jgi:pimeloyl-ACP methyl ester carboxylesterase